MRTVNELLHKFPPRPGMALVVGNKIYDDKPDRRDLYESSLGLDMLDGEGVDIVHDLEKPLRDSLFSHIDCCSVLEHTQRPWKVAKNMSDLLVRGGTILLTVPFVWRVHGYPSDYWRITTHAIPILFPDIHFHFNKYLVDGRWRKLVPGLRRKSDQSVYLARAEVVAVGVKK